MAAPSRLSKDATNVSPWWLEVSGVGDQVRWEWWRRLQKQVSTRGTLPKVNTGRRLKVLGGNSTCLLS